MSSKYKKFDISKVKTTSITNRKSKMNYSHLANVEKVEDFNKILKNFPMQFAAKDFLSFIEKIKTAKNNNKGIIWMFGAHFIKNGLGSIIIELIKQKWITAIAMNGAAAIHDSELCLFGETSEWVENGIDDGTFGMTKETSIFINNSITADKELGYGESIAISLLKNDTEISNMIDLDIHSNKEISVLANAYKNNIPLTCHSAIGTEIIHQHPSFCGQNTGNAIYNDFLIFSDTLETLDNGGVIINLGSAVIMPEVFLKSLTISRNVKKSPFKFTAANFDMIRQYRVRANVLERPTQSGGQYYEFIGHHEIMIPLIYQALINE